MEFRGEGSGRLLGTRGARLEYRRDSERPGETDKRFGPPPSVLVQRLANRGAGRVVDIGVPHQEDRDHRVLLRELSDPNSAAERDLAQPNTPRIRKTGAECLDG